MKRALIVLSLVLLAVMAAVGGGAYVLLATTPGAAWLIDVVNEQIPGELEVVDPAGSLTGGLTAAIVEYRQAETRVRLREVTLDLDMSRLWSRELGVRRLAAESAQLNDLPADLSAQIEGTVMLVAGLPLDATIRWREREDRANGRGTFHGTLDRLGFSHTLFVPDAIQVQGEITDISGSLGVAAVATWDELALPDQTLPDQTFGQLMSRDGTVSVEATLDEFDASLSATFIRNEEQQLSARADISGDISGDNRVLEIESLKLDGLGGELEADGAIELSEPPAVALNVTGRDFDPGVLLAGFDGRLSFAAVVDARWPERVRVEVADLAGEFLGSPVQGSGGLEATDGVLQSARATLRAGKNELQVDVRGQPRLVGEFYLDAPNLGTVWPDLAGELRGQGKFAGTLAQPEISADLTGSQIRFGSQSIERLHFKGNADATSQVKLDIRADGVALGEQALGNLSAQGSGTVAAHELQLNLSGGEIGARLAAEGGWDGRVLSESIMSASIDTVVGNWILADAFLTTLGPDGVSLTAHCWNNPPASICTDGANIGDNEVTVAASLSHFPLQTLNPWLGDSVAVDGEADATMKFVRGPQGFDAVLHWQQSDTRIRYDAGGAEFTAEPVAETRLTTVEFSLVADDEKASMSGAVTGDFGLTAALELGLVDPLAADGALAGTVQAEIPDIGELRPFIDPYVQTEGLVGNLLVDIRIGGTRAEPSLAGSAQLRDGAATIPVTGIDVEDISVQARAGDGETLIVTGSARSGDGVLHLNGVVGLSPETGLYGDVTVKGEHFQLIRLPDQIAYISADASAHYEDGGIELDGRLRVPEATFEFRELPESTRTLSEDVVIHREEVEPDTIERRSRVAGKLDIELGDNVTFNGLGISTRLTGGLLIIMREGAPVVGEGALQLADGTYDAFGREMRIERGSLNFVGPLDDPFLDVRATRRLTYEQRNVMIGVNLSGRLSQQLDFTLFSEPAMSESDVLSFIVVGRPASGGESDGAVSGAALAMGLQSLSASRNTGSGLNLDEMSFEGDSNDTSVVAGKRLGEDLYVRYTYGLFNRIGTFIVRYDLGRGVSIEAGSGEQQTLELIYSIDR